jgi:putative chitinase
MFPLSPERIASITGCPAANVAVNWPLVEADLNDMSIGSTRTCIAAIATIVVETAHTFKPIHEYGTAAYFEAHYQGRADLGNTHPGDGVKFAGRGLIQTTGEINYEEDGKLIGVDLLSNPDKALEPHNAAALFVSFFWKKGIAADADRADWVTVRHKVNGGRNGLDDFLKAISRLQEALK